MSSESRALIAALLMLLERLMAVFMEMTGTTIVTPGGATDGRSGEKYLLERLQEVRAADTGAMKNCNGRFDVVAARLL